MSTEAQNIVKMLSGHKNITCCRYNPVQLLRPWEWHTLLHDKFVIMDGKWLLLGGRNLGDRYFDPEGFSGSTVDDWEALVLYLIRYPQKNFFLIFTNDIDKLVRSDYNSISPVELKE